MHTARESIVVKVPLDALHKSWLKFTGQGGSGEGRPIPTSQHASAADQAEKGRVYFSREGEDMTLVTVELRYNAAALREARLTEDWVRRRIGLFLQRFKAQAER